MKLKLFAVFVLGASFITFNALSDDKDKQVVNQHFKVLCSSIANGGGNGLGSIDWLNEQLADLKVIAVDPIGIAEGAVCVKVTYAMN